MTMMSLVSEHDTQDGRIVLYQCGACGRNAKRPVARESVAPREAPCAHCAGVKIEQSRLRGANSE